MTASAPRDPAWPVGSSARWLWAGEGLISALLLLAAALAVRTFTPQDLPGVLRSALDLLPWVAGLYAVVAVAVRPQVRYRVHRWEVGPQAVHTRVGWWTQEWTVVPIARIQTVDIHRGALQRLFGLSTVTVLTASAKGSVLIPHLEHGVATRLAADLAARAGAVRDEAT